MSNGSNMALAAPESTGAMQVASREAAEVQAAIVAAQMVPRDLDKVLKRIDRMCEVPALAEAAEYAYKKGGTAVTGASIKLVEAVAQAWGNIQAGWRVLEVLPAKSPNPTTATDAESSVVEAIAWDVETNFRHSLRFVVPHWRDKTKFNPATPIRDARDVYELVANQASRRLRSALERTIPRWVIDHAMNACRATSEAEATRQMEAAKKGSAPKTNSPTAKLVRAFVPFGVTEEDLCVFAGVATADEIDATKLVDLRAVYQSIKDGAEVGEFFARLQTTPEPVRVADPFDFSGDVPPREG